MGSGDGRVDRCSSVADVLPGLLLGPEPFLGTGYECRSRLYEGRNPHAARCGGREENGAIHCAEYVPVSSTISSFCASCLGGIWNHLSSYRRLTGSRHDSCRSQTRRQSDQSSGLDSLQVLQPLSGYRVSCDGSGREASATLSSDLEDQPRIS